MTDRELVERARMASAYAYAPYSKFHVGAAVECDDGTVYTGCNVENASYGGTICAERVAIGKAVSEGHQAFTRIAIYGESKSYCMPCGICRQVMSEFSKDLIVLCADETGAFERFPLKELLPHSFAL